MERYIAERISDGQFVELELPVHVSKAGRKLCGAGGFSGTIEPDTGGLRGAAGELLIDERASFIHREIDGIIDGSWYVTRAQFGDSWQLEGQGFSSYLTGRPYEGEYYGVNVDMADVVRHVWAHAQRLPTSRLGVTVTGTTGVRRGTDSDQQVEAARTAYEAAKVARAAATVKKGAAWEQLKRNVTTTKEALDKAKERQSADGGAWKLLWWDHPDSAQAVQDAIDEAGYEWVEWSGWNTDRSKILKQIRIVERAGRRQNSLRFVEGENIIDKVVLETPSSDYANVVIAIGAGEGKRSLRAEVGVKDGRRRTPYVLDAKQVTKQTVLDTLARAELAWRSRPLQVKAIRVDATHPNAGRGTFSVGDTIMVDCDLSWLGRKQLWHRVLEIEWISADVCDLMLGVDVWNH